MFYIIVLRKMKESRSEKTEVIRFSRMFITANQWCDQGQWLGVVECKLAFFCGFPFRKCSFFGASLFLLRSARDPSHFAASSESGMFISLHSWLQRSTLRVYSRLYSSLRFQLALSTMIRGEHCTNEGGIKHLLC